MLSKNGALSSSLNPRTRLSINSELICHNLELRNVGQVKVVLDPAHGGRCLALALGNPQPKCVVRVQSRCLYGEVFGSLDCDCRDQLDMSWSVIVAEGNGVVIYLEQEGRASGLVTKSMAYRLLESESLDTFSAYEALGVPTDSRSYEEAGSLLLSLGLNQVRLLSNNPRKVEGLLGSGLAVDRLPLVVHPTDRTMGYLQAKKDRGHLL
jgi:GTP cyclohydrolase II